MRMDDVQSVTFLIPKKTPSYHQLVGFHLSLPMGYVDNTPYYCMATKRVADLNKKAIAQRDVESKHPLERAAGYRVTGDAGVPEDQSDTRWEKLLSDKLLYSTENMDVYLDDFSSVVQGGPK